VTVDNGSVISSNKVTVENNICQATGGINGSILTNDYNDCFNGTTGCTGTHTITSNPNFVSTSGPPASNFTLQPGSPAIGAGTTISGFSTDYFGNTRAVPWTIGAAQSGASATDTTPPSVPTNLSVSVISSSQINLSWTASTDPDSAVAGYNILRNGVQAGTSTGTSYSDTGLTASTPYTYTVSAFDPSANVSAASTSISATTSAATPPVPASITATSGASQSATVNTSFGTPLGATVKDASSNLLSGITVTFTAPASGASGTFTGGLTTATAITNGSGVATTPTFTANGTTGSYTVRATVSGVATPASFNLTNTAATPGCFVSSASWQSQVVATQSGTFTASFDATPSAINNDGVIGFSSGIAAAYTDLAAIVRFNVSGAIDVMKSSAYTADTSVAYSANTSYHFRVVINIPSHTYSVFVTPQGSSEVQIAANYAFRSTQATVTSLSYLSSNSSVANMNVCNVLVPAFDFSVSNSGNVTVTQGSSVNNTITATLTSGAAQAVSWLVSGLPSGVTSVFSQASCNPTCSATLTLNASSSVPAGNYTVTVTGTSGSNTRTTTFSLTVAGPVLSSVPASITATGGTSQNATVNTSFGTPLGATVKDVSSNLLSGISVTFTAPASGASGTFTGGLTTATATTNSSGVATAPTFTANGITGTYTVTATVSGVATPAYFSLTNATTASTTVNFTIPQNGGVYWLWTGNSSSSTTAYANLKMNTPASPSGIALISERVNGVLVADASAPASPSISSGRTYVNLNSPVSTGISFANPGAQDAVISFYFTNAVGDFGSGVFTLPAGSQMAAFLNQPPFNAPSMEGTFTFTSSVPVGAVAQQTMTNQRGELLYTTLPFGPVSGSASNPVTISNFANGGGWNTQVILTNPSDSLIAGTVQFYNQNGQPSNITVNGASNNSFGYSIPSHSEVRFTTSPGGQRIRTGSVRITPSGGSAPTSAAILLFVKNGINVVETSVPGLPAGTAFRTYAQMSGVTGQVGSTETGLAIANPSPNNVIVNIQVLQLDGSILGQASATIPGYGQLSRFVQTLITNLPSNFQGLLQVTSNSPVVFTGVIGQYNERGDFLETITTPRDDGQTSSNPNTILSQIVSGGGYTTDVVVFGPAGTGTLLINSQAGSLQ
jgi:hypothetical protein